MNPEEREHPGKAALDGLLRIQDMKAPGERSSVVAALAYLDERLQALEKTVADRNRAFKPPEPAEVTAYAKSIKFELDGAYFCDYYAARNWCVGKVKMKCWKAAVRTWKNRRDQEPKKPAPRIPDNLRDDNGL